MTRKKKILLGIIASICLSGIIITQYHTVQSPAAPDDAVEDESGASLPAKRATSLAEARLTPDEITELELDNQDTIAFLADPTGFPNLRYLLASATNYGWRIKVGPLSPLIGKLQDLEELHLCGLGLESLPEELGELSHLRILDVCENNLSSLPPQIDQLSALEVLDLSYNSSLTELPIELASLPQLASLSLYGNNMTELPDWIGNITSLQRLHLNENRLTSLPGTLKKLTNCTFIGLDHNEFTAIPAVLLEMPHLETIKMNLVPVNMTFDQVQSLFPGVELEFSYAKPAGQISSQEWETQLAEWQRQDEMDRRQEATEEASRGIATKIEFARLYPDSITDLTLSGAETVEFLQNPTEFPALTSLTLQFEGIAQSAVIPPTIGNIRGLHSLKLDYGLFTVLPDEIGSLTSLETLIVNRSTLTTLPETIGQLTRLQTLNLSWNDITALPDALGGLTGLQILNLPANELTEIPDCVYSLTGLSTLDLSGNQIAAVSPDISRLADLQVLILSHNSIPELPVSMDQLHQLRSLSLVKNNWDTASQEALKARLPTVTIDFGSYNAVMCIRFGECE